MTDHYAEAERYLELSKTTDGGRDRDWRRMQLERARVHAMLAAIPRTTVPVIVQGPAELIAQVKVTPPAGLHGGVLLIPTEPATASDSDADFVEQLNDVMQTAVKNPLDPRDAS